MRRFIPALSIALISITVACQKENTATVKKPDTPATAGTGNTGKTISTDQLLGNWKVVGNMISAGGPMYYVPESGNYRVEFKSDGTMSGTAFPAFISYVLKTDSVTVTMTKTNPVNYQNFMCHIVNDTLKMSPSGPVICIEGCVVELVKE